MFEQLLCRSRRGFHCAHSNGICHTGLLTACEQDQDGTGSVLILLASCMTYTTALCTRKKKTPNDGQRNCTKNVEFYPKNKFEKLLYLVSFIIRVYHDAQSTERQMWRYTVLKHQLQGPV